MSARASGSDAKSNGNAQHRQHNDGSSTRPYTVEQKAAVIRIKRCSPTAFYEILNLEEVKKTCTEAEIKKAYRKLSLLTHPDKNGYEGADEAFKLVSRAFQILSDPDKKMKYDKFGGDPDSRFGGGSAGPGAGASPFSNFARASSAGRAGPMFEEEISPEEMFRQFFGGGFGGPFGGFEQNGFVFNLGGGPGIRVHQFGGGQPRRRPVRNPDGTPVQQAPPSLASTITSLLPLLILFVFPLISSLFSGATTSSLPNVRFDTPASPYKGAPPYSQKQVSSRLKIPYWVNPTDWDDLSKNKKQQLDVNTEERYIQRLYHECEIEESKQRRMFDDAQGWFLVDEDKARAARELPMLSCKKLKAFKAHLR